jgi:hypothetical protein
MQSSKERVAGVNCQQGHVHWKARWRGSAAQTACGLATLQHAAARRCETEQQQPPPHPNHLRVGLVAPAQQDGQVISGDRGQQQRLGALQAGQAGTAGEGRSSCGGVGG